MHLHESAKRVLNEQTSKRNTEILREAFQYDVRRLEEARAYVDNLLNEGVLSESAHRTISDQDLLNEDLADIKANVARRRLERAAAGLPPLPGEAREIKAKADEAARRAASASASAPAARPPAARPPAAAEAPANVIPVNFGKSADESPVISEPPASTGTPALGLSARMRAAAQKGKEILADVRKGANLPPIENATAAKAKAGSKPKAESDAAAPKGEPTPAAPPAIPTKPTPPPLPQQTASAAVAQEAMVKALTAMAENDPQAFKKLVDVAASPGGVKKVEALLNKPEAKAEAESIKDELANSPEAQKSSSFLDKIKSRVSKTGAFAKKHPIMFWGGLGLITLTGGLAVVGAGGVGALATAVIAKVAAAKSIVAASAVAGAAISGTVEAVRQKKTDGKFQWGKIAKVATMGGLKRAGQTLGAVVGAAIGGEALKGTAKIGSAIGNAITPAGAAPAAAAPAGAAPAGAAPAGADPAAVEYQVELNGTAYASKIDADGSMDDAIKNINHGGSGAGDDGDASFQMHMNNIENHGATGADKYPKLQKLFAGNAGQDAKNSTMSILYGLNPADQHQLLQLAEKDPQNLIKLSQAFKSSGRADHVDDIQKALKAADFLHGAAASVSDLDPSKWTSDTKIQTVLGDIMPKGGNSIDTATLDNLTLIVKEKIGRLIEEEPGYLTGLSFDLAGGNDGSVANLIGKDLGIENFADILRKGRGEGNTANRVDITNMYRSLKAFSAVENGVAGASDQVDQASKIIAASFLTRLQKAIRDTPKLIDQFKSAP